MGSSAATSLDLIAGIAIYSRMQALSRSLHCVPTAHRALQLQWPKWNSGGPKWNSAEEFEAMLKKRIAGFPGLAEDLKAMQEKFASSRVGEGCKKRPSRFQRAFKRRPSRFQKR